MYTVEELIASLEESVRLLEERVEAHERTIRTLAAKAGVDISELTEGV